MKILLLVLLVVASCWGYSKLDSKNIEEIKDHLTQNNWNIYVVYFYNSALGYDDKVLRSHWKGDVLNAYGPNVYFAEIDVSQDKNSELLKLVKFDQQRQALINGNVRSKDVPFVMLMCHGLGWILQGDSAHHHIPKYMDVLIQHAERGETIVHNA